MNMTTLHFVAAPASDTKFIGEEPIWHDVKVDPENYTGQLMRGLNWHNYCASEKNYRKYLEEWIKEHRPATAKQDIARWREQNSISMTVCALARMGLQGFPLSSNDSQKIRDYIMSFTLNVKKKNAPAAKPKTGPSIQDRIRMQVMPVLAELDAHVDDAFDGEIPVVNTMLGTIFGKHQFKAPQINLIANHLQKQVDEWNLAYNKQDDQLVEGYAYVARRHFKNIIAEFTALIDALSQQQASIKTQRIRKRKPVDKRKMASKLRYLAEFEGIQSQKPVDIIGADMVWVYNTKKRRLAYYTAEVKGSLYVKANKIMGFKESCEKILRKPEEQLAHVNGLRKNQTVNWFDGIRAKCKTLTGRMNADTLILRID